MSTAIAERETPTLALPKDQIELITRTVAAGATKDELALFLYDCQRRGVHPLDKLLHFTKRGGKYTPITSIDFMRAQAAMSGEMAGSDDPIFTETEPGKPTAATVTVYRMTQGHRFAYTATARWSEYCPDNAPMWRRMPHTMLGKCAEACALRKAFPQQLAGLYSREEMDQADDPRAAYVVAPPPQRTTVSEAKATATVESGRSMPSVPNGGDSGRSDEGPDLGVDMPAGARRIVSVGKGKAGAQGEITFNANPGDAVPGYGTAPSFLCYKAQVVALAEQLCQNGEPCFVDMKQSTSGNWRVEGLMQIPKNYDPNAEIDAEIVKAEGQAF